LLKMKKIALGELSFNTVNAAIMLSLVVVTLYPFINTLAISFNDAMDTVRGGIYLWPREFTAKNYQIIYASNDLYQALMISILRTVTGSLLSLLCSLMVGFVLSRKDFVLRPFLSKLFVFTMYFSGGLIPVYFVIKDLGLINNFLVYILPGIVSGFNILIIRSFIDGLPDAFIESAKIDGASEMLILFKIITPLCMPVIATVALFVAVGQWNSWFDTYLYASSSQSLSTLQYELQKILQSVSQTMQQTPDLAGAARKVGAVTPMSIRASMTIAAIAPIIMVYPFLQKYFVKGMTLGGVKG
jgi:putative aldouronate transport system permease protein